MRLDKTRIGNRWIIYLYIFKLMEKITWYNSDNNGNDKRGEKKNAHTCIITAVNYYIYDGSSKDPKMAMEYT